MDDVTETEPLLPSGDDGACARCGGVGFVFLSPATIDRMFPPYQPRLCPFDAEDPGQRDEFEEWWRRERLREFRVNCRRDAGAWTGYPCPMCRPAQFARWSDGCYAPNHRCAKCTPGSTRRRGSDVPVLTVPPRKDLG